MNFAEKLRIVISISMILGFLIALFKIL